MVTHPHENLNMETVQRTGNSAHFSSSRRGYTISCGTLVLLGAFFLCTLATVSFLVYNFATCDQLIPAEDENIICTTVHLKHKPNETKHPEESMPHHERDVRLPRSIKPLKYNISLEPYLYEGNFTFDGEVQINILVVEDCYNITMHAVDLNISKNDVSVLPLQTKSDKRQIKNDSSTTTALPQARVAEATATASSPPTSSPLRIRKQYLLEAKQFFVIEFYDKLLQNTEYVINIKFSGLIQDSMQGFYRSSYQVGNQTRWLASTQFQATDARKAFPCFDEPALKAKFTMNIARPRNMSTLSNMPIVATRKHATLAGYEWDYFAESVPMSTYLVAYCISDFSHLSDGNFSVWATDDIIQSAGYALSIGPKALKFLEEFFDITFPLPKMDMIAVPDFSSGAMENWGLITFRETAMLFEKGVSASTCRQRVASVVAHELAHQWFGNLVTPSWWSDLWLNEGFATYMEFVVLDALEPEWKMNDQFVVSKLQSVFQMDSLSSSHKISVEVGNPDEVAELFDLISYDKGATVIRMMDHFLTTAVFRRGLHKYLKEMSYNSAEQNDLWHFLTVEAKAEGLLDRNATVKDIMDTWTLQIGFPIVSVSKHPNTNVIRLEQHQFSYNKLNNGTEKKEDALWWIPITYTTAEDLEFENTRPITWIPRSKVYEIENRNLSVADWFIFNIQQSGYYRVNYEVQNWQAITEFLMDPKKFKQIAASNRAQLIDDALNLAKAGYLSYDLALNLTRYLVHEDDTSPWKAAMNAFTFIDVMIVSQGEYDVFKNYLLKMVDKIYNRIGFADATNDNDMLDHIKRAEILHMACRLGHQACIGESMRHYQNWVQVPNPDANNPISPNLRALVYCTAIEYGTEVEWNFAFERFKKSTVPTEKEILLSALACSKEPWILSRLLRYAITPGSDIRKQDTYRVFMTVSFNVVGQKVAFDFVRTNWEAMKTYLGSSVLNFNSILKYVTKSVNTKYAFAELESFVKNDLKDTSRSIDQIIEHVRENVNWMNNYYKPIVEWLRKESLADVTS